MKAKRIYLTCMADAIRAFMEAGVEMYLPDGDEARGLMPSDAGIEAEISSDGRVGVVWLYDGRCDVIPRAVRASLERAGYRIFDGAWLARDVRAEDGQ